MAEPIPPPIPPPLAPPRALLAGGRCFALPDGAREVPNTPLRSVPLGAEGLLGMTLMDGMALPVLAAAPGLPGGPARVLIDGPAGRVVLAGEALLPNLPPAAEPIARVAIAARPPPPPRPAVAIAAAPAPRAARGLPAALAVGFGDRALVLPLAALETVLPMPALLAPASPGGALLGLAPTPRGALPVLDPARLLGGAPVGDTATQLVVFRHAGRRLGLPCARLHPAAADAEPLGARLDALMAELGPSPQATAPAPPPPEPTRALLLCEAAGQVFALPVEEVVAAIAPSVPHLAPGAQRSLCGVVAHRGDVLPVLDGGARLGGKPVLTPGAAVPMLRLALAHPVALAVSQVSGLRQVPERLLAAAPGSGPVAAFATLGDQRVPICRAAVLAGLAP